MKSIILLDDDEIAQIISKKMISLVLPDSETTCFFSPIACTAFLESINDSDQCILFSDLNLPDTDGWTFLSDIVTRKLLKPSQIIVLTSEELCEEGREIKSKLGIKHCLPKPLSTDFLEKHLRNI
ncbi:MAG: response regulator [Flavobacteriales bacterium]|nr:response regulator [Flavobacteriales bacterium]